MFDFSGWIDLPLIWVCLIATAVFLYVLLDGFDLGIGVVFPFAPTDRCRSTMMNSIAPFWDGNETWLVLGGGGLFAVFPLAYSIMMPALYVPVIIMLFGLILRGVAFEFRYKADRSKRLWDYVFHFGSLTASFMQGVILGAIVQGIEVEGRAFAGGPFDWLTAFSLMTGAGVVFGYVLLGSTWLIMKTEGETQAWAKKTASYVLGFVGFFMFLVSVSVPFINEMIMTRWFSFPNFWYLLPIPILTALVFVLIWFDLHAKHHETRPFFMSQFVFLLGYAGLGVSLWPWLVPYEVTFWDAAAVGPSLSLLLVGALVFLPVILFYTGYCYYVFRGKSTHEASY